MAYFTFLLLRPCTKWRDEEKIKTMSFHQYSWNSEVETTWISLICWHHKTSNIYPFIYFQLWIKFYNVCWCSATSMCIVTWAWTPVGVHHYHDIQLELLLCNLLIGKRNLKVNFGRHMHVWKWLINWKCRCQLQK